MLEALDLVHGIRELQSRRGKGRGIRLWPWSRMTGWRAVHAVMTAAGPSTRPQAFDTNNCGTPNVPQPCPPMPRHPLPYYPANKQ